MDTWRAYKGIRYLGYKSAAALVALDDLLALHDPATLADDALRSEITALHTSLITVRAELCDAIIEARDLLPQLLAIAQDIQQHIGRTGRAPDPDAGACLPDPRLLQPSD